MLENPQKNTLNNNKHMKTLIDSFGSKTKALEILFLINDMKPVVRQGFYENELPHVIEFCKNNNITIELSEFKVIFCDTEKKYSNKGIIAEKNDNRKGMLFVYISKEEKNAALAKEFEMKNDSHSLGIILGYPECCVNFFIKNSAEMIKGDNDYLRATVLNSSGFASSSYSEDIENMENIEEIRKTNSESKGYIKKGSYPFYTNISKRDSDITLLSHFPCSFGCKHSIDIGKKNYLFLEEFYPKEAIIFSRELKGRAIIFGKDFEFV